MTLRHVCSCTFVVAALGCDGPNVGLPAEGVSDTTTGRSARAGTSNPPAEWAGRQGLHAAGAAAQATLPAVPGHAASVPVPTNPGPPPAPTADVLAEGCDVRFGTRILTNGALELVVRLTGSHTPGATLDMRLYAQADGDGIDPKVAWESQQTVGADGSYRMGLWKPAVGSLDRCTAGWTARFVVRTPAGVVLQDRSEWVPLGAGEPR